MSALKVGLWSVCLGILVIVGTAQAEPQQSQETIFWLSIKDSGDHRDFDDYLTRFPSGTFSGLARRRIEALAVGKVPPLSSQETKVPAVSRPSSDGQWNWELLFQSGSECDDINRIKPLAISGGKITSSFNHDIAGGSFLVFGKVNSEGIVDMYANGVYVMVTMEGKLGATSGGGRAHMSGEGSCWGEWKAWR